MLIYSEISSKTHCSIKHRYTYRYTYLTQFHTLLVGKKDGVFFTHKIFEKVIDINVFRAYYSGSL